MALQLSRDMDLVLVFPFNLGFGLQHGSVEKRRALTERAAAALSARYERCSFAAVPYPSMPGTLLDGGVTLRGTPQRCESQAIIERAAAAAGVAGVRVGAAKEEVIYLDHGIGSVTLTIPVRVDDLAAIPLLPDVSMSIIDALRTDEKALALRADWSRFRAAARAAFEEAEGLLDLWGILLRGGEGRHFVACQTHTFVLYTAEAAERGGALEVEEAALPGLLATMTGLAAEENKNLLSLSPGVVFLAEGWNGQAAVLSDRRRTEWLWRIWHYATDSWSALVDMAIYLYEQTRELGGQRPQSAKEARRLMMAMERMENSFAVLRHEAVPSNIWDSAEQIAVHQGIFESWQTESLMANIEQKLEYMRSFYGSLHEVLNDRSQRRMDIIMATFTFMTFAGVLADCIAATDYNGSLLASSRHRLLLIMGGTLCCALISVIVGLVMQLRAAKES